MDKKTIELLFEEIRSIKQSMLTKEDVKKFLTKDDAKNFATKNDLKQFATKDDLKKELSKYATKDDIKSFVTKEYFDKQLKKRLEEQAEDICNVMNELFARTDELKADKKYVEALEHRIDRIEDAM